MCPINYITIHNFYFQKTHFIVFCDVKPCTVLHSIWIIKKFISAKNITNFFFGTQKRKLLKLLLHFWTCTRSTVQRATLCISPKHLIHHLCSKMYAWLKPFIAFIKASTSCFFHLRLGQRFPPWTQSSTRRGSMISSLPFCPSPRQLSSVHGDEEGRLQRGVEHSLARSATGGHPYSSYNHHSFTFWFSFIRLSVLWDHESDGKGQRF